VLAEASPSALAFTKQQFYSSTGLVFDGACASAPMQTPFEQEYSRLSRGIERVSQE